MKRPIEFVSVVSLAVLLAGCTAISTHGRCNSTAEWQPGCQGDSLSPAAPAGETGRSVAPTPAPAPAPAPEPTRGAEE